MKDPFPDTHHDVSSNTIFGFWVYLMTDCILFATFFAAYAVLRNGTFGGPTAHELLDLPFSKGDLYALSFPDNSFEVVVAFEVFGHIADIEQPIREMFRTASRSMIFTVWTGSKTKVDQEVIESSTFIRTTFAQEDLLKAIDNALKSKPHEVHIQPISKDKAAYIIHKRLSLN